MSSTAATPVQILRRPGEGHGHEVLGMRHEYKARPSEGAPNLMFLLDVPPGCGAPLHQHDEDGEAFYVLAGEITFITPDNRTTAGPGAFFYAGPGHVHAFENRSQRPARALVVQTPGIEAEQFFEAMAAAHQRPDFDPMAEIPGIADVFGITIHPPQVSAAA